MNGRRIRSAAAAAFAAAILFVISAAGFAQTSEAEETRPTATAVSGGEAAFSASAAFAAGGTDADAAAEALPPVPEPQATLTLDFSDLSVEALTAILGANPRTAYALFGVPVSQNVVRGTAPGLDDIVTVHDGGVYLFWFQDRVWQIGFGGSFDGALEKIRIGDGKETVIRKRGKPALNEAALLVYPLHRKEFPVALRFALKEGAVVEIYVYRSDL